METLVSGVTKEHDFGMINFIAKIKSKDNNIFEDVFKDGDMDANLEGRDMGVIKHIKAGMQKEKKEVKMLGYIVTEEKGDAEQ